MKWMFQGMYVCVCVWYYQMNIIIDSVWWKKIFFWRKPSKAVECDDEKHDEIEEYPASPKFPRIVVPSDDEDRKISDVVKVSQAVPSMADSESTCSSEWSSERKWPTPWHWQLLVLIVRTFRQSRHILLSKLNFLQTILLTIIVSIVWFQIPRDERSIADRYGYVSVAPPLPSPPLPSTTSLIIIALNTCSSSLR